MKFPDMNRIEDLILYPYISIKDMPIFLRIITLFCLLGFFIILAALVPVGARSIENQEVTFIEFWRRGAGIFTLISGIFLLTTGIGFIKRAPWSRILFLCLFPVQQLIMFFMDSLSPAYLKEALFVYIAVNGYLFFSKGVKDYLGH